MHNKKTASPAVRAQPSLVQRIKARIEALAASGAVFAAVGLYLLSLAALQISDQQIARAAPGITKPDLQFGYTYDDIVATFNQLGAAGRQAYASNLLVDSVMPVFFAAAVILVLARAFPRFWVPASVAPIAFLVLDLVENAAFWQLLAQYPEIEPGLVAFIRLLTMIKLSAFALAMPMLIVGAITIAARWLRRKR